MHVGSTPEQVPNETWSEGCLCHGHLAWSSSMPTSSMITTASSLQISVQPPSQCTQHGCAKFIKYLNDQLAKSLGLLSSTSKCCVFGVFVWSNDVSQLLTMKATTSVRRQFKADSLSRRSLGRSCFTLLPSVLLHEGKSCYSANMANRKPCAS